MSLDGRIESEEFVLIEDELNTSISDQILSEGPQSVVDEKHVEEVTIETENLAKDIFSVESTDDQDIMDIAKDKEEILEDDYERNKNYIYETDSFGIHFFTKTMKEDIERMENNLLQMKRQLNHVENTILYAHSNNYFEAMTDYLDYLMKQNYSLVFHNMYDYVTSQMKRFD